MKLRETHEIRTLLTSLILGCCFFITGCRMQAQPVKNGFDLSDSLVPPSEIKGGGPPKDGIPAISDPEMTAAQKATFLDESDQVIGVAINGDARAYPLKILVHHENVNDVVGGVPVAVTYWPLCNSSLVVDRRIGGEVREFGISGLLYNSNVLLYDRQPDGEEESLWSQVEMRAISGPAAEKGLEMELLPFQQTTWKTWKKRYPKTNVLSTNTGYNRNYRRNPYGRYFSSPDLMFRVKRKRPDQEDLDDKDMLLVVNVNGSYKGYPFGRVSSAAGAGGTITDTVDGTELKLKIDSSGESVTAHYADKPGQPSVSYMFWFSFQSAFSEEDASLYSPSQ